MRLKDEICRNCQRIKRSGKPHLFTITNNADVELIPEYLPILTEIEEMLIARVHVHIQVFYLYSPNRRNTNTIIYRFGRLRDSNINTVVILLTSCKIRQRFIEIYLCYPGSLMYVITTFLNITNFLDNPFKICLGINDSKSNDRTAISTGFPCSTVNYFILINYSN